MRRLQEVEKWRHELTLLLPFLANDLITAILLPFVRSWSSGCSGLNRENESVTNSMSHLFFPCRSRRYSTNFVRSCRCGKVSHDHIHERDAHPIRAGHHHAHRNRTNPLLRRGVTISTSARSCSSASTLLPIANFIAQNGSPHSSEYHQQDGTCSWRRRCSR